VVEILIEFEDGTSLAKCLDLPCTVGRDSSCNLRIGHWRVGKEHVRIRQLGEFLQLEDLGTLGGTRVNGSRVSQHFPLLPTDDVVFGPCRMRVRHSSQDHAAEAGNHHSGSSGQWVLRDSGAVQRNPAEERTLRATLHAALVRQMDVRKHDLANLPDQMLRQRCASLVEEIIEQQAPGLAMSQRRRLVNAVVSDAVGYGPLQALLDDPAINEIMVNRHDRIYVERSGKLCMHTESFSSEAAVRSVIERIVYPLGRRIDDASPMVDARLPDGSRVNAVLSPISVAGSCITIRKFPSHPLTLDDLITRDCLTPELAGFLCRCVQQRISIIVSGGTGSGKTTFLNILASQVPESERMITIEDAAELRIDHPHVLSLEARPSNAEGRGEISIRNLVRNALRMRPDRIIVGECRAAEALDMLAAMNTGHEGSLSTLHANSPRDAVSRLETMVLMASAQLPLQAIRELIARSVQLIVQLARLPDGSRRLMAIDEITGIESGQVQMQSIVRYQRSTRTLKWLGIRPAFLHIWQESGVAIEPEWFGHHDTPA